MRFITFSHLLSWFTACVMANHCGDMASHSAETKQEDKHRLQIPYLCSTKQENTCSPSASSFETLNRYASQLKRFKLNKPNEPDPRKASSTLKSEVLSSKIIVRQASMRLSQFPSYWNYDFLIPIYPSGLHTVEDLDFALYLVSAAEKFCEKQFCCTEKLLTFCSHPMLATGSPVARVVYHFAEALKERINREKGRIDIERVTINVEEAFINMDPRLLACERDLPCTQISHIAGVQVILDNVASAESIHLVDFAIEIGSHWTILMHALANRKECAVMLLKITAVGTYKDRLEETGKWLSSFAASLNLTFSFKVVLSEIEDLKLNFFEPKADEALVVYSRQRLGSLLAWPNRLETLLGVLKSLNPCLMVLIEMEADTNAPSFMDRFYAALFLCSALFDCLNTCLENDNLFRKTVETAYLREAIRNTIATEGEERAFRHLKIASWRKVFGKYGIVEVELSQSCSYQADLVIHDRASWSSCSLEMDSKSIILQWKGTPITSVSAWKFQN